MYQVILITGSNTGIGFELVRLAAQQKHTVYLSGRNEAAVKAAVETLHSEGLSKVKSVVLDVTKPETIEAARATIEAAEGHLDVLVNNAAISLHGRLDREPSAIAVDSLRNIYETNVFGQVQTTTILLPLLRKAASINGLAAITNVSSGLGSNSFMALPDAPHIYFAYSTTKAALNSYTIHLAYELEKEGIKVNSVTPGHTATQLNAFMEGGKTPLQAAQGLLHLVMVNKDAPTAKFFGHDGNEFQW